MLTQLTSSQFIAKLRTKASQLFNGHVGKFVTSVILFVVLSNRIGLNQALLLSLLFLLREYCPRWRRAILVLSIAFFPIFFFQWEGDQIYPLFSQVAESYKFIFFALTVGVSTLLSVLVLKMTSCFGRIKNDLLKLVVFFFLYFLVGAFVIHLKAFYVSGLYIGVSASLWYFAYFILYYHGQKAFRRNGDPSAIMRGPWNVFGYHNFLVPAPTFSPEVSYARQKDTLLSGATLLVWSLVLTIISEMGNEMLGKSLLGLDPLFLELGQAIRQESHVPLWALWLSTFFYFLKESVFMFANMHLIVGVARIFGYHIPRAVRSPFLATDLIDFFSRFNFYYKELLVKVFYLPSYLALPRKLGSARAVVSLFMAAGLGNYLFHYLEDPAAMVKNGFVERLYSTSHLAVYGGLLSLGIIMNHWFKKNFQFCFPKSIACPLVFIFYGLLHIFYYSPNGEVITLSRRFVFLIKLLGGY